MRKVEAAGMEDCQRRQLATSRARVPWTKGGGHRSAQCMHPGAATRSQRAWAGGDEADRHMKLLTIETESRLSTLWDQERCTQFCSKDELWEAAKEEEMKIPWKDANEGLPVSEE
jgi:hypothetical protein